MIKDFILPSKMYRTPYSHEIDYYNKESIQSIIDSSNYFSRFFFNDFDYKENIFDYSKINLENKSEADKIYNFYNSLDYSKIKGDTPLQKAIFLQKFIDNCNNNINSIIENIDSFDKLNESEKFLSSMDLKKEIDNIDIFFDLDFFNLVKLKNKINLLLSNSNKSNSYKKIKGDKKVKNKKMQYSDIPFLSTKIIYEDFDYKFITKNYNIDERFSLESQKSIDIVLYDFSSSMSSYAKRNISKAIVLLYLENVYNNKSKLCFCYFVESIIKKFFIDSKEKAKDFFKLFLEKNPNGGLTDLNNCLLELEELINIDPFFSLIQNTPVLTIINDGQDKINSEKTYNLRINAFSIEKENIDLEILCKKHNGVFSKKI